MRKPIGMTFGAVAVMLGLIVATPLTGRLRAQPPTQPAQESASPVGIAVAQAQGVVDRTCRRCHNDGTLAGNLSLAGFDVAHPERQPAIAEKMIRKLQAGMMPPAGAARPDEVRLTALATVMADRLDAAAAAHPNPGRRTFQRLNRSDYARSVRDLLDLEVDVAAFLPPDTISHGFDNIADVQTLSPTLMEGYLRAASRISTAAVGDRDADASEVTFKVARTASQMRHVEGAPFGTRGGVAVLHNFAADGEYVFRMMLHGEPTGRLFGTTDADGEQLEVAVDGERVALLDVDPFISESDPTGLNMQTEPIAVRAGSHRVSAAFIERFAGPVDDLIAPIEHTLADSQIGTAYGITMLPHLRDLSIVGPYNVTGVSETLSRQAIFSCRPTSPDDEMACASEIVTRLAARAYRRPPGETDRAGLLRFYEEGRAGADFEAGIRTALRAILASPHFVFRVEQVPADVAPGEDYRLGDLELASRLSFFLWGTAPDAELIGLAAEGVFSDPVSFEQQARRMLEDPRSEALATRFAAQWLRLQDLELLFPDALNYPQYDKTLGEAMRRETELFFAHLVRADRPVTELLTADYTFVNERLAKHYAIPNVTGHRFRRVSVDENRHGLLGHGSVLASTSFANRTSPVLRGKWVMEVLLGSPPPPPPPDVPDLEETDPADGGRLLSVRERLEQHRASPACSSCHRMMDPIGLALEGFDVTGAWRIKDSGVAIDASGELYDGTPLAGPADLRAALVARSDTFITTFTENLMAYGLGRRVEYHDMPAVRAIVRSAAAQQNRVSAFVLGVVNSAAFQMSRVEQTGSTAEVQSESGGRQAAR